MMDNNAILNYKIFPLGKFAFHYIQQRFKISSELTKRLNNSLDLSKGQCFTFFPEKIDENKLDYPEDGGILKIEERHIVSINDIKIERIANTLDGLVEYINQYLKHDINNIIVVENFYEELNDNTSDFFHKIVEGNNVYYYLTSKAERREIVEVIKECSSKPEAIGLFSRVNSYESFNLNEIVNNVEEIYVEAYDHEGYIIWKGNS